MTTSLGPVQHPAWLEGGSLECFRGFDFEDVPVTSAFVIATSGASMALTEVASRGWDLPGGHLDPGERAREAAARELTEETGLVAHRLELVGSMRLDAPGQLARTGRYPDLSVMAVYRARFETPFPLVAGLECTRARWVRLGDVPSLAGQRAWLPFLSTL